MTCTACEIIGDRGVHNFRAPRNPLDSRDRHDLLDSRNPRNLLDSRDPRDPRDLLDSRGARDARDARGTRGFTVYLVHIESETRGQRGHRGRRGNRGDRGDRGDLGDRGGRGNRGDCGALENCELHARSSSASTKNQSEKRKRRESSCSTRQLCRRGEYRNLFPSIKRDPQKFLQYMRMSVEEFHYIVHVLYKALQKDWCNLHNKPILPEEEIVITIRFLATGQSYVSLAFAFNIGVSTA
ncbi:unnamed protein product, partial [Trichogramma brassicae]